MVPNTRLLLFCLLFAAALLRTDRSAVLAATPWLTVQGTHLHDPSGHVVVLRGISLIDLANQNGGKPNIQGVIDTLTRKDDPASHSPGWYPKVLRLPILPSEYKDPSSWQPGSDTFYKTVLRPTVDYCKAHDLYCIVDMHFVDNIDKDPAYVTKFWTYMAPKFAQDSNVLFELYNEPIASSATAGGSDSDKWNAVRGYMQTWYDLVRKAAPRNVCLIGTPQYSQILIPAIDNPVIGSNIMYVVHTYPLHFKAPSLVHQIDAAAGKIPLFMSEWGFYPSTDSLYVGATQDNYGLPLMQKLDRDGISWTAWVASDSWGPPMFHSDGNGKWDLRVGEQEMGGFVKDALYQRRSLDQPTSAPKTASLKKTGTPHRSRSRRP